MRTPLPRSIPTDLPTYLPGRITVVPDESWDIDPDMISGVGIRVQLPRYGMDLHTRDVRIDAGRVRWLAERATVRPLDRRHVHLFHHRGRLHVVDGHHALAAHLITGTERIPAKLVAPTGGN